MDSHHPNAGSAVTVIGAGLAGTEAALQLARRGVSVILLEMRPVVLNAAHKTDLLGELVCSNSFKSDDPVTAAGHLKREIGLLGSEVLRLARQSSVPAGAALAVDRTAFGAALTAQVAASPNIELRREEATEIPPDGPVIVASGPLTSPALQQALEQFVGPDRLAFFDASAPIVDGSSVDLDVAFAASRYDKGGGADYLNCPMDREAYDAFVAELVGADRVRAHEFETSDLFAACQPVEEIARRSPDALRFGSMKPVGLLDPRTGERPWAVVQLRSETASGTAYNLVGFQTNLTFGEQRRVFSMIPGLGRAEFLRYGVMHRNTFINAPAVLDATLAVRTCPRIRIAGQLSGTEGYSEAISSGLLAALNTYADMTGTPNVVLPPTTALGSLIAYATDAATTGYQPMHVNWGLVPPLDPPVRGKQHRYAAYSARADRDLDACLDSLRQTVEVLP
ncbi:MAG: methylenetetrahydrofolate--tRNA-(uracil(54)-C(5))-methyltransferase (FADH(2)-oxidizing) TrmFO [Actinomycetota bacterium]|nr:methylenetetrahydrofolate--tRNA-(uracil(54)-C(5))-methyltransferase (FADH(2)-oxidizing) TrmFO [Actinomycetota bacterium]